MEETMILSGAALALIVVLTVLALRRFLKRRKIKRVDGLRELNQHHGDWINN